MWLCIDCDKEFENPCAFENPEIGLTCPFCGSISIVDCSDFYMPEMSDEVPESVEEQMADTYATIKDLVPEQREHPNCKCTNKPDDSEYLTDLSRDAYGRIVERIPQLSFDDLRINRNVLLNLPIDDAIMNMKSPAKFKAYDTYMDKMTERFLHTFIDDCFVP